MELSEDGYIPNGTALATHASQVVDQVNKRSKGSADIFDAPQFYEPIDNQLVIDEGEPMRLMTRVGPAGDSTLDVEWYKDGKQLNTGSRFSTIMDRGFVVLDILYTIEDDAGEYVCVAKSNSGMAESNRCTVQIIPESSLVYQTQLPQEMMERISALDTTDTPSAIPVDDKHSSRMPPQFINPMSSNITTLQGNPVYMEAFVEPHSDSSLTIEWFRNGLPLTPSSRSNVTFDRGYCALSIRYCYPEDSGSYTCVARNAVGQAESLPVILICNPEESIITKSNLTESSISQIKSIENPGEEFNLPLAFVESPIPPSFLSNIEPSNATISEGSPAYFSVKVNPGNGQKLNFDWYHNDEVIEICSRLTGTLEMNVASIIFRYSVISDTGSYKCVIFSEYGRAETQPVMLNVTQEKSIIMDPQSKNINAIHALEAELNAPKPEAPQEQAITDLPSFLNQLEPIGEVVEGDYVSFKVKVEPAIDNSLRVEWFKGENQLINGARCRLEYERGIASLSITSAIAEDTGDYWALATNKNGQTPSNRVTLVCHSGDRIVTTSSLLEDSEGYKRLKEMEEDLAMMNNMAFQYIEEQEVDSPPNFDFRPQNTTAAEGGPAKFLVKISGFPRPTVEWQINGEPLVPDSINKTYNDGSINYLEISRCMELGDCLIHVIATNALGTTEADAVLTVVPVADFRPDLRHIHPENPYKKMAGLKRVECTPELSNAMRKNKPSVEKISNIEKTRFVKSQDVIQTEMLYDQVASKLRKSQVHSNMGSGSRSPNVVKNQSPVREGPESQ